MNRLVAGALRLLAVAAACGLLLGACTDDGGPASSTASGADRFDRPGMHAIEPPPLDDRHGEVRVLADGRLLIWGGQSADSGMEGVTFGDGAALNLGTGEWTDVADSPFSHGLYSPAAAFDGDEVVVIGTECAEEIPAPTTGILPECSGPAAAAWDPSEDRWRRLPAPPIDTGRDGVPHITSGVAAGADGHAVFVDGISGSAITWDRDGNRWGTIEPPLGDRGVYCADPTQPWVVATTLPSAEVGGRIALLRPAGAGWTEPVVANRALRMVTTCGGGVVVSSGLSRGDVSTSVIDPLTGTGTDVLPDLSPDRVAEAVASGPWMFVQTTPMPEVVGTTTTTLGKPLSGSQQRPDGRTMSVQLLPNGPQVPPRTDSNIYTLTGPWSAYVGRGIVICDLARPAECRMWVPPAEATPE